MRLHLYSIVATSLGKDLDERVVHVPVSSGVIILSIACNGHDEMPSHGDVRSKEGCGPIDPLMGPDISGHCHANPCKPGVGAESSPKSCLGERR